ncbi:glycosyltransferase [Rheinheimera maricola]|uniref:Glycosyltransferase n=1 Tax=Rheinheimera maricola TaxID=2793282 RepID=A0ABS7X482_9GAMM|nr:glycosyltransferase [Rheinheimera maricola]MBZ9610354.1 glycosyltransferase [Rheinheimera maricola]
MSKPSDKAPVQWLALVLSPQASSTAAVALAVQAKADGLSVLLAGGSVTQVFADADMLEALKAGVFERVLISTAEHLLVTDALDAVKCLPNAIVWLTLLQPGSDIAALQGCWQQPTLPDNILSSGVITTCANDSVAVAATASFRSCTLPAFCLPGAMLPALLAGQARIDDVALSANAQIAPTLTQQALFVSAAGVQRFGGLDTFLTLPLYQGDVLQGSIARCWQLTAGADIDINAGILPVSLRCDDGSTVLFDLLPAQQADSQHWQQLAVPRMVLSLRLLPAGAWQMPEQTGVAVFAMSLYNKAAYLHQAVYSVAMQTYSKVALHIIDDASTDGSVLRLQQFQALAPCSLPIRFENSGGVGTYVIRNRIIKHWQDHAGYYLVQDADDISSSCRALYQVAQLQQHPATDVCIADMVRIDSAGQLFSLEGLSERYGSATLCAAITLHQKLGYYENLCKNADSEFIDRLKSVYGRNAAPWYRYPVLYQRYDGNNLTADIYQQHGNQLQTNHGVRSWHKQLYQQKHASLNAETVAQHYQADQAPDNDYQLLLDGFVPPVYKHSGSLSAPAIAMLFDQASAAGISFTLADAAFQLRAELTAGKHQYLYATHTLLASNLRPQQTDEHSDAVLPVFVDADFSDNVLLVLLYLDAEGNRLAHEFFAPATNLTLQLPAKCSSIKLGFRCSGKVAITLNAVRFSHQALDAIMPKPASGYLLITNHYPSDDSLYRNAFVHSRVKGYAAQGVKVDVFRSRPNAPLSIHQFDGVNVTTGCPSLLLPALRDGLYKHVLVHFLDSAMWRTLQQVVAKVPVTVWLHGAEIHSAERRKYNYPDEASFAKAQAQSEQRLQFWRSVLQPCPALLKLIFVSQHFAEEVMADLALPTPLPGAQYQILPNPIDTHLFQYQPKQLGDRKKILVLRPFSSAQYANDLAVAALVILSKQPGFDQFNIAVMGDGPQFEAVTAPLVGLKNVRLQRGFLTQQQIAAVHKQYGVFLCPTRWDSQGVSRDEAMASGLVAVTNAVAAVPEFCDSNSAMLCDPESPQALAEAVLALVRDPSLYLRLSDNGAVRVAQQRSAALIIKQELALFYCGAE